MDKPASILKSLPARTAVVWLLAALVGVLFSSHSFRNALHWDALLYLGFLVGLTSFPQIQTYWSKRHTSEKRFLVTMVFLMLVGQIAQNERKIFPLTCWNMYGEKNAVENEVVEFVGVTADGHRYQLNPAVAFPTLGNGTLRIHNQMEGFARGWSASEEGDLKDEFASLLQESLLAVARKHVNDGRTPPLTKVEVYRVRTQGAESKRLLIEFDLAAEDTSL